MTPGCQGRFPVRSGPKCPIPLPRRQWRSRAPSFQDRPGLPALGAPGIRSPRRGGACGTGPPTWQMPPRCWATI
eukprot:7218805-Alexandrium_andersonii.AAC.1